MFLIDALSAGSTRATNTLSKKNETHQPLSIKSLNRSFSAKQATAHEQQKKTQPFQQTSNEAACTKKHTAHKQKIELWHNQL